MFCVKIFRISSNREEMGIDGSSENVTKAAPTKVGVRKKCNLEFWSFQKPKKLIHEGL